jgi:hypothetical protein
MVSTDPQAEEYKRRARDLRRVAAQVDAVDLAGVEAWAGPDTWVSPAADDCRAALARDHQRLGHAVNELGERARRLERDADGLEAAAALRLATGPR